MESILSLLIPVPITWIYVIIMCLGVVCGLFISLMLVRSKLYILLIVILCAIISIPSTSALIKHMRNVTLPLTIIERLEKEPYLQSLFKLAPMARYKMYNQILDVAKDDPFATQFYLPLSYVIESGQVNTDNIIDERQAFAKFSREHQIEQVNRRLYNYDIQSGNAYYENQEYDTSKAFLHNIDGSKSDEYWQAEALSHKTTNQYFNLYLLLASNESIWSMLKHKASVIGRFENQPIACVGYFLNDPRFVETDMSRDWMQEELLLRMRVLDSAEDNVRSKKLPTMPDHFNDKWLDRYGMETGWWGKEEIFKHRLLESLITNEMGERILLHPDEIIQQLESVYRNHAYDINNLSLFKIVDDILLTLPVFEAPPSTQDCNRVIQFSQALVSMDATQASMLFKSILYFTARRDIFLREIDLYYEHLRDPKYYLYLNLEWQIKLKEELSNIKEQVFFEGEAKFRLLRSLYSLMMPKYNESLITASSESIYQMLKYRFRIMKWLSDTNNPEACLQYFREDIMSVSDPDTRHFLHLLKFATEWLEEDLSIKSAIIGGPRSQLLPANNINDVNQAIKKQYTVLGYSTEDYDMLTQINTMPPVDACRIATEFSHTISSMEPDKATYIFKNLLYFAEH